jgi:hypothetical protein
MWFIEVSELEGLTRDLAELTHVTQCCEADCKRSCSNGYCSYFRGDTKPEGHC